MCPWAVVTICTEAQRALGVDHGLLLHEVCFPMCMACLLVVWAVLLVALPSWIAHVKCVFATPSCCSNKFMLTSMLLLAITAQILTASSLTVLPPVMPWLLFSGIRILPASVPFVGPGACPLTLPSVDAFPLKSMSVARQRRSIGSCPYLLLLVLGTGGPVVSCSARLTKLPSSPRGWPIDLAAVKRLSPMSRPILTNALSVNMVLHFLSSFYLVRSLTSPVQKWPVPLAH